MSHFKAKMHQMIVLFFRNFEKQCHAVDLSHLQDASHHATPALFLFPCGVKLHLRDGRTVRPSVSEIEFETNGRTDGQTRTATTSTAIAAVTPCRRRCDS